MKYGIDCPWKVCVAPDTFKYLFLESHDDDGNWVSGYDHAEKWVEANPREWEYVGKVHLTNGDTCWEVKGKG